MKNPRGNIHRSFTALIISMSAWTIANYLADQQSDAVLLWNRLTFLGPLGMALSAYLFLEYLAGKKRLFLRHWAVIFGTIFATVISLSNYTVVSVVPRYIGGRVEGYNLDRGYGYWVVILWLMIAALVIVYMAFKLYVKARGILKTQLRFIFTGFFTCAFLSIVTNVVFPLLLHTTKYTKYAPLSTLALSGAISYAILKHRFLDIRAVVARSVAYVILIGLLAGVYLTSLYALSILVFRRLPSTGPQDILNVVIITTLLILFQFLRKFFEKFTNSVFYRDAYDTQEVLGKLSRIITKEILIENLQDGVLKTICASLHVSSGQFIVTTEKTGIFTSRIHGQWSNPFPDILILEKLGAELVVHDELPVSSHKSKLMKAIGCKVSLPLLVSGEIVGYILLGEKKSGDMYTVQDINLLEVVEGELAISVKNARSYKEIAEFNEILERRVSEATKQLKKKNKRLRELDSAKDEFMSMASHQLRTPTTSIKGYLSMALDGDAGPLSNSQRSLIKEAYDSSQRMVYLIGDFLNVSRLQTGSFELERSSVNLPDLIVSEIGQLDATARSRQVKLIYEAPESFPILQLDENKIRQVMMNLIDNAIYYSKPGGGVVQIILAAQQHSMVFKVIDNGIGVPEDEKSELFSKFYRASNAKAIRPDGTGIGLYMVKKVVEAHNGEVIFESSEGKGSTFGFRLPNIAKA
jgi:signal transduction histidine kinase